MGIVFTLHEETKNGDDTNAEVLITMPSLAVDPDHEEEEHEVEALTSFHATLQKSKAQAHFGVFNNAENNFVQEIVDPHFDHLGEYNGAGEHFELHHYTPIRGFLNND